MRKMLAVHRDARQSTRFWVVILPSLWLACAPLHAGDPQHLPAKAKAVAEKFEAFKESAAPAVIEAKRKQVLAYLGALLNEEAAAAHLDSALAVKDLIERIGSEPPVRLKPAPAKS